MGETLNRPERIEKTPEERHAQAMRIASMLVERAMKLPDVEYPQRLDGPSAIVDSMANNSSLRAEVAGEDGDLLVVRKMNSDASEDTLNLTVQKNSVHVDKVKSNSSGSKDFKRLRVDDFQDKQRSSYVQVEDGVKVKQAELGGEQADKALAAALMEARGAIAQHEIANKKMSDTEVESMF
jgi:hypothetical protein